MNKDFVLRGDIHGVANLPVSVTGWEIDVTQAEPGRLESDTMIFHSGPLMLVENSMSRKMVQAGATPVGRRAFSVQLGEVDPYLAYGKPFSRDQILAVPTTRELDSVSPGGFHNVNISVPDMFFEKMFAHWESDALVKSLRFGGVFRPDPIALAGLKTTLRKVLGHVRQGCEPATFPHIRDEVLSAFSICFSSASSSPQGVSYSSRKKVVRQAVEYIKSSRLDSIALADLCQVAEVSERTLLYAFRQEMGLTPKGYLKAHRLQGVHKELRAIEGGSVTEVATRWGFWHMGQFGVDYKRLFGELPSKTLREVPRKVQFLVPPHLTIG